jgi:hypothetical protein
MTSAIVKAAVDSVLTGWSETVAPIRKPNTDFTPPAGPWIMTAFPGSAIGRADIGAPDAPMWDETGAFMLHVFTPLGAGTDAADAIADALWELFRGEEVDGVRFDERLAGTTGEREIPGLDGVYWGASYGITFRLLAVG